MRLVRNASLGLLALTTLALAGCSGDSNDPAPFDPAGMAADLDLGTMFDGGPVAEFFLMSAEIDDALGGAAVVRTSTLALGAAARSGSVEAGADALQAAALETLAAPDVGAGMAAVIIPEEIQGTTYEWNTGTNQYEPTERTGAPSSGVRFIVYAMDPIADVPAEPLNEVGHIDLTDGSTASTDAVRIQLVSGNTTYVDYAVAATATAAGGTVVVDGFLDDGNDRLEFDLEVRVNASSLTLDYDLDIPSRDVAMNYTLVSNETGVTVDFEVDGPNGHLSFTGGTTGENSEAYSFEVNGEPFATLTWTSGGGDVWTGAGGQPLTADEIDALANALDIIFVGLEVANALMFPIGGLV